MFARKGIHIGLLMIALSLAIGACKNPFNNELRREPTVKERMEKITAKIRELEKKDDKTPPTLRHLGSLYNHLGDLYMEQRLWNPAIENFQKALGFGHATATTNYSLGLAYANRGVASNDKDDFDRAETCYRRALEEDPKLYQAKYALAILLFYHRDNRETALDLMNEVVASFPKYYPARFALGRFHYELNDPGRALAVYESLNEDLQKLPDSAIRREYLQNVRDNISRIMQEESVSTQKKNRGKR